MIIKSEKEYKDYEVRAEKLMQRGTELGDMELLTDEEKITMCDLVTRSGADFIKTSTGFSTGGATFADVELFAKHVGEGVKIKAAGGIRTIEDALAYAEEGCSRIGSSKVAPLIAAKYNL